MEDCYDRWIVTITNANVAYTVDSHHASTCLSIPLIPLRGASVMAAQH